MVATLTLWGHALAALLFGALALWALRRSEGNNPRTLLAFALGATALWALAVAGIGGRETATRVAETLRNFSWLAFMVLLHRRVGTVRPAIALGSVYGVVALVALVGLLLAGIANAGHGEFAAQAGNAALLLRMLVAVAALVLVQALYAALSSGAARPVRGIVLALAGMWCIDFNVSAALYLMADPPAALFAVRGGAMVVVALAMAVALQRKGEFDVRLSRTVAYQSLSLVAIAGYFLVLALVTSMLATVGGDNARILQTAFVFGSTAAILTLVSSTWLRAWVKVKLAKHFFAHRYDYRAEWMRFTETLGAPEGAAPLEERIVKAVADLTDSPAGLLLVPEGEGLGVGATWNWPAEPLAAADAALAAHLATSGRILEIDSIRAGDSAEAAVVPQWMLDMPDAWALVPLPHMGSLAGAILLARPPVSRALDWEDFDLLKAAGRQVASYLAEARAQAALADAQRFDEFNRRFAFILHDIKNLVSQLTLTARNAERHADKPEFRADMVATLQDSAEKMNALLARLSQHHQSRGSDLGPVEVVPLVTRIAAARRDHPVVTSGARDAIALADPANLEQLLGHLVQNAIEASPASEPVTIAIASEASGVLIDVIDKGCGMSPAFVRDQLFKPFVSTKTGGFGIGAFEARQLATAMHGRLEVTSREGAGTRFRLVLKAANSSDLHVGRAA